MKFDKDVAFEPGIFYVFKPGDWMDLSLPDDFSKSSEKLTQTGLDVVKYDATFRDPEDYYQTTRRSV